MTESLMPDFEAAARRALDDLAGDGQRQPDPVRMLAAHMKLLWEAENVAAESAAKVRGAQLARTGHQDAADICYGIAGQLEQRRRKVLTPSDGRPF